MYKYLLGLLIIVFSVSLIAFQPKDKKQEFETVTFQYTPDEVEGIDVVTNWNDVTDSSPTSCGDEGDLPCVVQFSTEEYAPDNGDRGIASFLTAHPNASSIMNSIYLQDSKEDLGGK